MLAHGLCPPAPGPCALPAGGAAGPAGCPALARRRTAAAVRGLSGLAAALAGTGAARPVPRGPCVGSSCVFKHGGRPSLAFLLAGLLLDAASCLPLPDAVLGIPQHKDHLRRRGYNQAHELAVALGLMLSLPVHPGLLRRPAAVPHQTGLTASRRRRNAAGTFRADGVRGLRLWLVDDIITTGSTLRAAGEELRRAGAARVDVLALARTPLP